MHLLFLHLLKVTSCCFEDGERVLVETWRGCTIHQISSLVAKLSTRITVLQNEERKCFLSRQILSL